MTLKVTDNQYVRLSYQELGFLSYHPTEGRKLIRPSWPALCRDAWNPGVNTWWKKQSDLVLLIAADADAGRSMIGRWAADADWCDALATGRWRM